MIISLLMVKSVFGSREDCQEAYEKSIESVFDLVASNSTDFTVPLQIYFSGKDINDLGHYSSCLKLANSRYVQAKFEVAKGVPGVIGLCVPEACDKSSLQLLVGPEVEIIEKFSQPLSLGGIITLVIILVLLCLVCVGTILQRTTKNEIKNLKTEKSMDKHQPNKIIDCFAFQTNWNTLQADDIQGNSKIFNGVRVFSMSWVILGHVYSIRIEEYLANIEEIFYVPTWGSSFFVYGALYSVDCFFWIGGFLLGYISYKELARRKGKVPWGLSIVMRVLRLIPAYIFTIIFISLLVPSTGSGPKWHLIEEYLTLDCKDYWWTNLLFLNNFVPGGHGNDCIGQSWYLAADFQFFVFSIGIVVLYYKCSAIYTWVFMAVSSLANVIIRGFIAAKYKFTLALITDVNLNRDFIYIFYPKPYTRFVPYFVGVLCGLIYYQYETGRYKDPWAKAIVELIRDKKWAGLIVFFSGWGCFNGLIYLSKICYEDRENDYMGFSENGNIAILAVQGLLIAVCFFMIFIPILVDRVPVAAKILGASIWIPLSKLTYSIFLIHYCVLYIIFASELYGTNASKLSFFTDFVYCLIMSWVAGFGLYMLVEGPFSQLISSFKKQKDKVVQQKDILLLEPKEMILNEN